MTSVKAQERGNGQIKSQENAARVRWPIVRLAERAVG